MPRAVESHLLQQRVRDPHRVRMHLCGNALIVAETREDPAATGGTSEPAGPETVAGLGSPDAGDADADDTADEDRAPDPWVRGLFLFDDPAAARLDRDRRLTSLTRTGHHLLASPRFEVPAVTAMRCYTDLTAFDGPFEEAWARTWASSLRALDAARLQDAGAVTDLVLLANYDRHAATFPWGPTLTAALAEAPQALHAKTGLLVVGVGPATRTWLQSYYASVLEKTPPSLPAENGDTSLTYTFALGVWQPELEGPISQLAAALVTARDLASAGVEL